jgi:hypothetical protein
MINFVCVLHLNFLKQVIDIYKRWYDHQKTKEYLNAVHFRFVQSVTTLRQLVRLSDISIVGLEPKSDVRQ